MLAQLSQWLLIAAVGQAAPEAALLKAAPAEVDVAVRIRGIEETRDELLAMIKAMDPEWGNMAEGALSGPLAEVKERHGARALKSPLVALARMGEDGQEGGPPPLAILMPWDDYAGTLKEFMGGKDVELKHEDGGYDSFEGPGGHGTWYAARAAGVVAFGTSRSVIADIAKPGGKTLDSVLTGAAAKSFFRGDLGVYVNAASLSKRYAEQIEQGRQTFMAMLDQAGQQAGNANAMQLAKDFYSALFDSLKYADALTLDLDAAEKGLHLAGFLKLKADSDLAKAVADVRTGESGALGKLPTGAMAYVYMNVGSKLYDRFQGMGLKMMGGAKPSPEVEKAMAELHGLGRIEATGSVSMDKGMFSINEIKTDDPGKFLDKSLAILRAMSQGETRLYKDLKVEPDARTELGLRFTHVTVTMDMEKVAEMSGNNPAQVEAMKSMFGDGRMQYWFGTDGKRLLQVVAPRWEDARMLVEGYLKGEGGVGRTPGFKAVVPELPARDSFVMLMSMQGLVQMFARQFEAMTKNPNVKAPEDMPREAAYVGASLTPQAGEGYEFHLVVPSGVGPVVTKGMVPLFQVIAGAGANP